MFMEILYKQTALFPLVAADTKHESLFIDRLKHLAELPPPPPSGSVAPAPPRVPSRGYRDSKEPRTLSPSQPPQPWPVSPKQESDSWFFPLLVILLGSGEEEGKKKGYSGVLPTPYGFTQCHNTCQALFQTLEIQP